MMNPKKYMILVLLVAGLLFSCEDYLDINDNPNEPTEASIIQLLPSAQLHIAFGLSNDPNRVAETNMQRLIVQRYDAWNVDGSAISNSWRFNLYAGGLRDAENIITQASESGDYYYVGISKLLKAYAYSMMVDMWDNIPYSEACSDEDYPRFDNGADIYDDLFALIDEALSDLEKGNTAPLSHADLIYGGDIQSWKRMGNTLKMKMYNQIRLLDPARARAGIENLVAAEQANPGQVLITRPEHDFIFRYGSSGDPENRHPGFQNDYMVKGEAYVSNFFYNHMTDHADPRVPYYFFNQSEDGFLGRHFGDPAPIGNDNMIRTVQGVYPVGGRYDNGQAMSVSGTSAPGNGQFRMLTNVMRLFMEAEAALTLNASVSASDSELFRFALEAAFADVERLNAPAMDASLVEAYIQQQMERYLESSSTANKLELLMTEKWIALFGNGLESYNDYRRTGFPVLPEPIETNNVRMLRFPYPEQELNSNKNAPPQPVNNQPVFWHVN
jgi:hypothetical protein